MYHNWLNLYSSVWLEGPTSKEAEMESKQGMNHGRNEASLEAIPKAIKRTVHELLMCICAAS